MEGGQRESSIKRESRTQIKIFPCSPLTSFALRLKTIFAQESNKGRRLNNTNSALGSLLWEMEGSKPRKHAPALWVFCRGGRSTYTITPLNDIPDRNHASITCKVTLRFQSNLDSRQGITKQCSQRRKCEQRDFTSVREKLKQKLAGNHKRFLCYKREKFKGTWEARTKQISIAFQCFAKEGVKWGEGGFK